MGIAIYDSILVLKYRFALHKIEQELATEIKPIPKVINKELYVAEYCMENPEDQHNGVESRNSASTASSSLVPSSQVKRDWWSLWWVYWLMFAMWKTALLLPPSIACLLNFVVFFFAEWPKVLILFWLKHHQKYDYECYCRNINSINSIVRPLDRLLRDACRERDMSLQ